MCTPKAYEMKLLQQALRNNEISRDTYEDYKDVIDARLNQRY